MRVVLRNAMGVGGVSAFPEAIASRKRRYEGVRFDVISVARRWVGVKFPGKKRYVTLEWPHNYVTASIHLDGVIRTAIILTTLETALRIHVFLICRATTMVLLKKNIYWPECELIQKKPSIMYQ